MDLASANGTYLNGKKIEPRRYYELFEKDVLKFGYSSREYVLLHEHSADAEEDDNMVENLKTEEIKTEADWETRSWDLSYFLHRVLWIHFI